MRVFDELAESCLAMTRSILQKHRYRIAGTEECRRAAREIADRFRESCDDVREEDFLLHPKALWYVGRAIAVIYLIAATFMILGGAFLIAGAILCLLGLVYGLVQYVFYGRFFDRFFKSAGGLNVVGSLEPRGGATRQIILVGHHDSPYIFSFLERFQSLAFIRFLLAMLSFLWLCGYAVAASIQQWLSGIRSAPTGLPLWITAAGLPFAIQLFFMMSRAPSPGAGDNLNSTSMLAALGRFFRAKREKGAPLERTRIVLLSTDGEEIGQRGAIHYVRSHREQLRAIPTFVFNIDSVYRLENLKVLTRDRNCFLKLSAAMAAEIRKIAGEQGLPLKKGPIPFGGGGTDAAAFAAAGLEAASLIGMPTSFISKDHLYHTSKDTLDRIEPAAVAAVLRLVAGYIGDLDKRS
jgi:aminopeptidase YwaD